ncbi:MAG TPA: penicillin-binding protein activator LpoB [Gammaproteobacteria bacterium]|nr:penicillin-binding protein activator LpoB [Gammaproteobacteria bacterium]
MNHYTIRAAAALAALLLTVAGCATKPKVERIGVEEVRDVSGRWNDTDSRLVSEEMVRDVLSRPWLTEFMTRKGKRPAVIVGDIRNLSHEHINVGTFIGDIERELINSGRVDFVASRVERGSVREERADQDVHAREDTRKAMGQEIGADFMLSGTINTIVDAAGKEAVVYYQVDLTLIDMLDNRKVWVGQKKIKKAIERPRFRP